MAVSCYAQPEVLTAITCSGVTTSTTPVTATSSESAISAYVEAMQIVVTPAGAACDVTVSTSGAGGLSERAIYSNSAATGSSFVRPVAQCMTNGTLVAEYAKEFIASDKLKVSAHTADTNLTLTVTVTPVIERKK